MTSKIFYKFTHELGTDAKHGEIIFPGSSMKLSDLKRELTNRLGGRTEPNGFDLAVKDADTNEAYSEDSLVQKNATVLIDRVPVANTSRRGAYQTRVPQITQPSTAVTNEQPAKVARMSSSEDFGDVFSHAQEESEKSNVETSQTATQIEDPDAKQKAGKIPARRPVLYGRDDPSFFRYQQANKKKNSGIPKNFLEEGDQDSESTKLKTNANDDAFAEKMKATKLLSEDEIRAKLPDNSIPEDLRCALSRELLKDAVLTSCCKKKASLKKIEQALIESQFVCPFCGAKDKTFDSLNIDNSSRQRVRAFLENARVKLNEASTNSQVAPREVKEIPLPSNNKLDMVLDLRTSPTNDEKDSEKIPGTDGNDNKEDETPALSAVEDNSSSNNATINDSSAQTADMNDSSSKPGGWGNVKFSSNSKTLSEETSAPQKANPSAPWEPQSNESAPWDPQPARQQPPPQARYPPRPWTQYAPRGPRPGYYQYPPRGGWGVHQSMQQQQMMGMNMGMPVPGPYPGNFQPVQPQPPVQAVPQATTKESNDETKADQATSPGDEESSRAKSEERGKNRRERRRSRSRDRTRRRERRRSSDRHSRRRRRNRSRSRERGKRDKERNKKN